MMTNQHSGLEINSPTPSPIRVIELNLASSAQPNSLISDYTISIGCGSTPPLTAYANYSSATRAEVWRKGYIAR